MKPQIKESRIGLFFEKLFVSKQDLISLKINEILSKKYPTKKEIKYNNLNIQRNTIQTDLFGGYMFNSSDQNQIVYIEPSRILFIDKSAYTNFKDLLAKYEDILEIISQLPSDKKINAVVLTTNNIIECEYEKREQISHLLPNISLSNKENNNSFFASIVEFQNNIFISKNPATPQQIDGLVSVRTNGTIQESILQLIFNNELSIRVKTNDVNKIKEKLEELHTFRNEIFFSNIKEELCE